MKTVYFPEDERVEVTMTAEETACLLWATGQVATNGHRDGFRSAHVYDLLQSITALVELHAEIYDECNRTLFLRYKGSQDEVPEFTGTLVRDNDMYVLELSVKEAVAAFLPIFCVDQATGNFHGRICREMRRVIAKAIPDFRKWVDGLFYELETGRKVLGFKGDPSG